MKMKKVLALVLAFAITVSATIGGTMAYLQAHVGDKTNTFAVGGLDVTLSETTDVITKDGGIVEATNDGANYTEIMPGDKIVKEVKVTNNDETEDAYVKVTVTLNNADLINKSIDEHYEVLGLSSDEIQEKYDEIFDGWGLNYTKIDEEGKSTGMRLTITGSDMPEHVLHVDSVKTIDEYALFYTDNWFGEQVDVIPFDGYYTKGMDKYELRYVYYIELPAGESTILFNGFNVPMEFNAEQLAMFEGLVVDITADAVQAANFDSAKSAFMSMAVGDGTTVVDYYHKVANSEELAAALAEGEYSKFELAAGTYHMPEEAKGKTFTIKGTKDTVIEVVPAGQGEANGQLDYNLDGSTVTFEGVTIKTNSKLYAGYARLSATYNNCVIQNTYNLGVGNSKFNNCVFNITNEYLRVGGASNATFNGCTFNTDGRAILVFQDGTNVAQTVTVRDCVFNATVPANTWNGIHVAAVSIDGSQGGTYVVNLEGNNTVDSDFNGLWQIKAGEANVIVNEHNKLVDTPAELANALKNAEAGEVIGLATAADYGTVTVGELKDVTITGVEGATAIIKTDANTKLENVTLKNIDFKYTGATADCGVVIDPNAKIDNLVIEGCDIVGTGAKAGRGLSGLNNNASITLKGCNFKDIGYPIYAWGGYESLTVENCTFENIKSWAIMPQSGFDGDLTVTGCTFKDCIGGGLIKAGTLTAGHTFTFTNNTITGCTIAGDHNWFQFNTSAGTTVIANNTKDGAAWTPDTADGLK